jgi:osmotically-inducible protein OsmY
LPHGEKVDATFYKRQLGMNYASVHVKHPVMNTATLTAPLFERIHEALTSNPHVPTRALHVETADGRVVLKGSVRSFFQKQMAQEAIRRIDGVQKIDNLLEVNWA